MHPEKVATVKAFAIGVYFVLCGILVYLLMFNMGIKIEQDASTTKDAILLGVKNESMHIIRNVKVSYVDADLSLKEIGIIDKLMPDEKKEFEFVIPAYFDKTVEIVASAPYHIIAKQKIGLQGRTGPVLNYTIKSVDTVKIDSLLIITAKICNKGNELVENVKFSESHNMTYFKETNGGQEFSLRASECKDVEVVLTPLKTGRTAINFNINANEYNEDAEKEIEVIGNG